ncbi:succinylglutamate desuccinylase/aspartoacylase family protein [Mitsuaria sp. WAJ17]|uniref:succinylglutamate desuccinylase/aspartoacylase domain-containing protein n=1 Tax=Mitsuaria sp. WAJ17 TaxID=2761452 RepID=UPI001603B946|nr:succinylglutamate desuccinylase/aspartoacylase family protein [Mitsuaria sp. WAJ17]MBB2486280.1 succinylglutamate desuccinylase/aspartoacylase family protein [Mitsuaria sp. WAJ17]
MGLPPPESVPLGHLRLHQYLGLVSGPRLLITAAVHGNESCGAHALYRLVNELDAGTLELRRGQLTVLPVTNPLAWQRRQRQGERNLNRRLMPSAQPANYEDRVGNVLSPLLAAHEVLLDLHSFQGEGEPFVMLGPRDNSGPLEPFAHAEAEARLARELGAPRIVEGWMRCYARGLAQRGADPAAIELAVGTTEAMRRAGGYGVTLECGQHADPTAVDFAHRAVRRALALLDMIDSVEAEALPPSPPELLEMLVVIDRLHPQDRFARVWRNFDPVNAGECIGWRHDGQAVLAPGDGRLVFPDEKAAVGTEWVFWARASERRL